MNTETCAQTEVLDSTGEYSEWQTVVAAVPANGTYRFVFVSGTYDKTWGSVAGAIMFLDDVVLSPNEERVAQEQAAAPQTPTPAASLAKTGANSDWLLVSGLIAAFSGAGLLVFTRRKRIA